MLPKYVGSFTAEVRTVYFCHRFEVSSLFTGILRRNSEVLNSTLDYLRRSQIANIYCNKYQIFFDHLKGYLSAF